MGIRRYQNKDGSLTEEGKKRLLSVKDTAISNNPFVNSDGTLTKKGEERKQIAIEIARKYQNKDGSLTEKGLEMKKRTDNITDFLSKKLKVNINDLIKTKSDNKTSGNTYVNQILHNHTQMHQQMIQQQIVQQHAQNAMNDHLQFMQTVNNNNFQQQMNFQQHQMMMQPMFMHI